MADQDDFSAAFDEATGLEPGSSAEDKEKEASKESEGRAEEPREETKPDAEAEEKAQQREQGKKEEVVSIQSHRSLQGMYNSEIKKREKIEAELAELRTKLESAPPASAASSEKADEKIVTAEDIQNAMMENPKLKEWVTEFPDVADGVLEIAKTLEHRMKAQFETLNQNLQPVIRQQTLSAEEAHFSTIYKAHQDFDEIVKEGALKNWIQELPPYKQEAYMKVYQAGNAAEVIDMVSDFKNAKGIEASPSATDDKLQDLDVNVRTKRPPVSTRTKRGAETFEDAFQEAIR